MRPFVTDRELALRVLAFTWINPTEEAVQALARRFQIQRIDERRRLEANALVMRPRLVHPASAESSEV
jgi:hypothetical protein